MKKIILLLFITLLFINCGDLYTTKFKIQNELNEELLVNYQTKDNLDFRKKYIPSNITETFALYDDTSSKPRPSDIFEYIEVFVYRNNETNIVKIHEQNPIDDQKWEYSSDDEFNHSFVLIISNL